MKLPCGACLGLNYSDSFYEYQENEASENELLRLGNPSFDRFSPFCLCVDIICRLWFGCIYDLYRLTGFRFDPWCRLSNAVKKYMEWCEGRRVFVKKFNENPMNFCTDDAVFETIILKTNNVPTTYESIISSRHSRNRNSDLWLANLLFEVMT